MNRIELQEALAHPNVRAFLRTIRGGETCQTDEAYRWLYGSTAKRPILFDSYSDHPRKKITAAGHTSTAAGAYQILTRTWDGLMKQYDFNDFGPDAQDEACVALIRGRKALADVMAGRFEAAIAKCNKEWASLPGSPYGQPLMSMEKAKSIYQEYGGTLSEDSPVIEQPEQEVTVIPAIPFLGTAIKALLPMAPELIKLFGNGGEVNERNVKVAQMVVDAAKDVTGTSSGEEAVTALSEEPQLQERFKQQVAVSHDEWFGMIMKMREADEKSIQAARDFNNQPPQQRQVVGNFTFVELLSLMMFIFSAVSGVLMVIFGDLNSELKGAIVTLMLIGGFNKVAEFWLGSSFGSLIKNNPPTQKD